MATNDIEIRGLVPWIESGGFNAVMLTIAKWYEGSGRQVRMEAKVRPWEVQYPVGPLHLHPAVIVEVAYGPDGYQGFGELTVWEGADAEDVQKALRTVVIACREAHRERKARGTLYAVPKFKDEILPRVIPGGDHPSE